MKDLSICIVSPSCHEQLAECLRSIQRARGALNLEIIVCIDGSADNTVALLSEEFTEVRVLSGQAGSDFAAQTNLGFDEAQGEMLMMLDPTNKVEPGALEHLVRFLHDRPEAGAVGPRLVSEEGQLHYTCHVFPTFWLNLIAQLGLPRLFPGSRAFGAYNMSWWDHGQPRRVDWLSRMCIALRRDVWQQVGPLDEDYSVHSEDLDWCFRLSRAGFERWYLPGACFRCQLAESPVSSAQESMAASHRASFRFFGKSYGLLQEVMARLIVIWGGLLRGSFWTIVGPMVQARPGLVSDGAMHFRMAELAAHFDETFAARRHAEQS